MEMKEVYCRVRGRVQMVMFRDFAERKARTLGLVGYVRNEADGTVEIVAQGEKEDLERFITLLRKGPLLARVLKVEVEWREPKEGFKSFDIVF